VYHFKDLKLTVQDVRSLPEVGAVERHLEKLETTGYLSYVVASSEGIPPPENIFPYER
jgi:hypothetical protein